MSVIRTRKERILEAKKKARQSRNEKIAGVTLATAVTASALLQVGIKSAEATSGSYKVKGGDTLYKISKKYDTTVTELKKENNLTTDKIFVGQKLDVPTESHLPEEELRNAAVYTVVPGDTLWGIAEKFNISVQSIKQLNALNENMIVINQKLILMEDIVFTSAKIVGAADQFTVEFKTKKGVLPLKVTYGTAQNYQKSSGKEVIISYRNDALINIQ